MEPENRGHNMKGKHTENLIKFEYAAYYAANVLNGEVGRMRGEART